MTPISWNTFWQSPSSIAQHAVCFVLDVRHDIFRSDLYWPHCDLFTHLIGGTNAIFDDTTNQEGVIGFLTPTGTSTLKVEVALKSPCVMSSSSLPHRDCVETSVCRVGLELTSCDSFKLITPTGILTSDGWSTESWGPMFYRDRSHACPLSMAFRP